MLDLAHVASTQFTVLEKRGVEQRVVDRAHDVANIDGPHLPLVDIRNEHSGLLRPINAEANGLGIFVPVWHEKWRDSNARTHLDDNTILHFDQVDIRKANKLVPGPVS